MDSGCTFRTPALHLYDPWLPQDEAEWALVKFFQLPLQKLSFGQLSPWVGLVTPGQGSLGEADPSSEPIRSDTQWKPS